jgi:hypothetical protein
MSFYYDIFCAIAAGAGFAWIGMCTALSVGYRFLGYRIRWRLNLTGMRVELIPPNTKDEHDI